MIRYRVRTRDGKWATVFADRHRINANALVFLRNDPVEGRDWPVSTHFFNDAEWCEFYIWPEEEEK